MLPFLFFTLFEHKLVDLLTPYEMGSAFDCVAYNLLFLVFILLQIKLLISFIYFLFLFCDVIAAHTTLRKEDLKFVPL